MLALSKGLSISAALRLNARAGTIDISSSKAVRPVCRTSNWKNWILVLELFA
jgi:hypothetical protein